MKTTLMSIEDFYEEPDASPDYSVHPEGTVDVDHSQITLDEVTEVAASNVTDLAAEREKRRKKEEAPAANNEDVRGQEATHRTNNAKDGGMRNEALA